VQRLGEKKAASLKRKKDGTPDERGRIGRGRDRGKPRKRSRGKKFAVLDARRAT